MTTSPPVPITYMQLALKVSLETENTSLELFGDSINVVNGVVAINPSPTSFGQFQEIVRDAERMILQKLDVLNLHIYADTNLPGSLIPGTNAYIAIPQDCVLIRYLEIILPAGTSPSNDDVTDQNYGTKILLRRLDETTIQDWWPNPSVTGVPKYYAVLGSSRNASSPNGQLLIAPTPGIPYNIRMGYIGWPDALSPTNTVTYLSTWYPYLLFLGCMIRATAFMKNTTQVQVWATLYGEHLQDAVSIESRRKAEGYSDASKTTAPLRERNQ